ncbi:hypothetical protein EN46_14825 [Citrobacter amalonaticus]
MGVSMGNGSSINPRSPNNAICLLARKRCPPAGDKHGVSAACASPACAFLTPPFNGLTLIKTQWMNGGKPVFQSTDIDSSLVEIEVAIMQIEEFTDAHAVTERQQNKTIISLSGCAMSGSLHHGLYFFASKITTSIHNALLLKYVSVNEHL